MSNADGERFYMMTSLPVGRRSNSAGGEESSPNKHKAMLSLARNHSKRFVAQPSSSLAELAKFRALDLRADIAGFSLITRLRRSGYGTHFGIKPRVSTVYTRCLNAFFGGPLSTDKAEQDIADWTPPVWQDLGGVLA